MKGVLYLILIYNFIFVFPINTQINGVISMNEVYKTVPKGYSNLWGTSLELGIEYNKKTQLTVGYKNYIELYTDGTPKNKHYHFIGLNSMIYLLDSSKTYKPFIQLSFATEFKRWKWGRYDSPLDYSIDKDNFYPNHAFFTNATNIYYSTPFLGEIQLGVSIFSSSQFRVIAMLGYSVRVIRYKHIEYESIPNSDEIKDRLNQIPMQFNLTHLMSFQIGIIYSIPFTKTNKM